MHCLQMVCRDCPDDSASDGLKVSPVTGYLWNKGFMCFLSIRLRVHTKGSSQTAVTAWTKF